jgi:Rieske Fe-S protein
MTDKIKKTCDCDCFEQQATDPSRRDFIRKASTLTIVGGTAFLLEACGGGGSPTSSGGDTDGGGDNSGGGGDNSGGGGDNSGGGGDNSGGGNTGYNYDPATGVITIDTSMIYQTLQNIGGAIALSGSDTFDNRGIIVLRTSNTGVRALSRNCTHAGFTVNINTAANNLVCPSHNSIFDLNGNVVSGPASGALTRYSASLSGSIITITQGS